VNLVRDGTRPRSGCSWSTIATTTVAALVVVVVPAAPGPGGSNPPEFCAALRTFNMATPSSKARSAAVLATLGRASPPAVRKALATLASAVKHGNPLAVLTQASAIPTPHAPPLTAAGKVVTDAASQQCGQVVTFLAALPTGGKGRVVAPTLWARSLCGDLTAWGSSVNAAGAGLVTTASGVTTTLPEVRSMLADFLSSAVNETEQLLNEVNTIGSPQAPRGASFAALIHAGVASALQAFMQAKPVAQSLPDDPHAFQVKAQALVATLDATGKQVEGLVRQTEARVRSAPITKALTTDPACTGIG
jgi:hypothetical protein